VQNTIVSSALLRYLLIPMILLWVYHLSQRRHDKEGGRKREATLFLTLLVLVCWGVAWLFQRFGVPDVYLVLLALAIAGAVVWQRRRLFPFHVRCERCRARLPLQRILFNDSRLCPSCELATKEGEMAT
jgi:hypothetical protein